MNPIIATAGSSEKLDFCKKLGATHVVNYKTESFKDKVAEITNKQGIKQRRAGVRGEIRRGKEEEGR